MNDANPQIEVAQAGESDIDLLTLVEVLAKRIRLLLLGPLLVGIAVAAYLYTVEPIFTARTVLMLPNQQQNAAASVLQNLGSVGGMVGASVGIKNPSDTIVSILKSRTVADRVIARFNLKSIYKVERMDDARAIFGAALRASAGKDGLITVEVEDRNPKQAMEIANAIPQELTKILVELAQSEAQQRRQFFEQQLADTKDNLAKAGAALKGGGIDGDTLKNSPEAAVSAVAQIQALIAAQEVRMGVLRGYLTENAPDYKQAANELDALRAQLRKLEAKHKNSGSSSGDDDYVQRFRTFKYYENLFEQLSKHYEAARLNENQLTTVVQVLDVAVIPEYKSKPKRASVTIISTMLAGLFFLFYVIAAHGLKVFRAKPENEERLRGIVASLKGRKV